MHKRGKASAEVEKAKVLIWFNTGDEIVVDRHKLKQIVEAIRSFPDGLVTEGFDPSKPG